MEESNLYVDKMTKNKLSILAKRKNMSMIGLIRYWIQLEVKK